MTAAIESKLKDLAIAYAQHRKAMRQNNAAIKQVQADADDGYFDLKPYRDRYWTGECHDLMQGEVIVWHGWLHALETCEPDKEHDNDCGYRATAILMDERKSIQNEGSRIRRSLCVIGDKLLKESAP